MNIIETENLINTNIVDIWEILTNFPAYKRWNPYIKNVEKLDDTGINLRVEAKIMNGKDMTLRTKMAEWRLGSRFAWHTSLFDMHWLLSCKQYFYLKQVAHNETKCLIGMEFSGMLGGYACNRLAPYLVEAFGSMQEALKMRCEDANKAKAA